VPATWYSGDGLVDNGIFETEIRLVAEEQNGEIVLVNKPVTNVIDISAGHLCVMSKIHNAGYSMVGFSGQFAKMQKPVITCGDTQIRYIPRNLLSNKIQDIPRYWLTFSPGIKKMYLVEHFHDIYRVSGCADALGLHIFALGDVKLFLPKDCRICHIRYRMPDVNAVWDFTEPIPCGMLVGCSQRCGFCNWVEKN
jgi:hypothetical protein